MEERDGMEQQMENKHKAFNQTASMVGVKIARLAKGVVSKNVTTNPKHLCPITTHHKKGKGEGGEAVPGAGPSTQQPTPKQARLNFSFYCFMLRWWNGIV